MVTEDYISFETAKLLKEKGFKQWCRRCYAVDVRHKGKSISFDEELDLKDEGLGDEIEYIDGGRLYDYGCNNSDKDAKVWAAPTLWSAMKWLREVHNIFIGINTVIGSDKNWGYEVFIQKQEVPIPNKIQWDWFNTYEEACESAIKYTLKNLI